MDIEITPRSVFSIQKDSITNKTLSISTFIGSRTVSGTPTMTITDSDGTDVTANYGSGVSYASGVITFGVKGYDTGTFQIVFDVTFTDTTPSGTALIEQFEVVMQVTAAAGSATASTAETLASYALCTLNDAKVAMNISLSTTTNDTLIVHLINNITELIEQRCRRRLAATSYTNELYDGNGEKDLLLKNYPINTISRLSIGTSNAIRVQNTNAHTVGSVSVTSSSVVLRRNGSIDSTLTFATYTTISSMVTAISAVSGWSAEVINSTYNSYLSSELLSVYGLNTIDSTWANLIIPDMAEEEYTVYYDQGRIHYPGGFPRGHNNVIITHNSGYSTIPYDVRDLCTMMVKEKYNYSKNNSGFKSENIGKYSYTIGSFSKEVQDQINKTMALYKRVKV